MNLRTVLNRGVITAAALIVLAGPTYAAYSAASNWSTVTYGGPGYGSYQYCTYNSNVQAKVIAMVATINGVTDAGAYFFNTGTQKANIRGLMIKYYGGQWVYSGFQEWDNVSTGGSEWLELSKPWAAPFEAECAVSPS